MKAKTEKKLGKLKKQENKREKEKDIKEIENDILSSPKNINLFNKLIELFIKNIENKDEQNLNENIKTFTNILSYYLKDKTVKSSNELISFLYNKIELLYKIVIDSIIPEDNNESLDISFLLFLFKVFQQLTAFISEEKIYLLFKDLLWKLISLEVEISINVINSFYEQFDTIHYYNHIFDIFINILKNKMIKSQLEFINFYNFIINIKDLDSFFENENTNDKEEVKVNELKDKYQNIIISLINDK